MAGIMRCASSPFSRRAVLASGAAALVCASARADAPPGAAEYALLMDEGRYLPLLAYYQSLGSTAAMWLTAQIAAMTGDEDAAFAVPATTPLPVPDLAGVKAADAVETIAQAAKTRRIVILNEAHHASRCRAFAAALAVRLAGEGFTHFAAETFDNAQRPSASAAALNAGAAITPKIGWYAADPVYAEMLRTARHHGYRFAAYEARAAQIAGTSGDGEIEAREDGQANNFIAALLEADPRARVFVVCGYDHVLKAAGPDGRLWFAARLKAKTGLDPLCISQSWGLPESEEPAVKAVLDTLAPVAPVVLFDGHDHPVCLSRRAGMIDVEVIHPEFAKVDGRPGWLAQGRKRAPFALASLAAPHDLIQAVPASEAGAPNAVPSDQYPLAAGAREAVFYLAEGHYEIRLETADGRSVLGQLKV
jgi:hypothetical protein